MAELHWFPVFVADWLTSDAITLMLPEQEGAFFRLLLRAWGKGELEPCLPDDDAKLAALSRLGKRWGKLGSLIREQFVARDGALYNVKLSAVWEEQQTKHYSAVERGKLGARTRSANLKSSSSSASSSANGSAQAKLKQLELERERERTSSTTPPPRTAAVRVLPSGDPLFAAAWAKYPRRAGGNSRVDALKQWRARVSSGVDPAEMDAGTERYAAYVRARGSEGTEFVMQAARFYGQSEQWREPWTLPASNGTRDDRPRVLAATEQILT